MVECDVSVPKHLEPLFEEFQPVFKNIEVSRQDLSPHMRDFAVKHKLMSTPRRLLVGSFFGSKLLFLTPLLKWYLEHGLQMTCIYFAVEFDAKACFKPFVDEASAARLAAARDSSKKILGECMKLVLNSANGKTAENQRRQRDHVIVDPVKATQLVNIRRYRSRVRLGGRQKGDLEDSEELNPSDDEKDSEEEIPMGEETEEDEREEDETEEEDDEADDFWLNEPESQDEDDIDADENDDNQQSQNALVQHLEGLVPSCTSSGARVNPNGEEIWFEMEMAKKVIKYNLPQQIAFAVYQYAKLRMLEFYYDFLDKYLDRKDFQLMETDTGKVHLHVCKF